MTTTAEKLKIARDELSQRETALRAYQDMNEELQKQAEEREAYYANKIFNLELEKNVLFQALHDCQKLRKKYQAAALVNQAKAN